MQIEIVCQEQGGFKTPDGNVYDEDTLEHWVDGAKCAAEQMGEDLELVTRFEVNHLVLTRYVGTGIFSLGYEEEEDGE